MKLFIVKAMVTVTAIAFLLSALPGMASYVPPNNGAPAEGHGSGTR